MNLTDRYLEHQELMVCPALTSVNLPETDWDWHAVFFGNFSDRGAPVAGSHGDFPQTESFFLVRFGHVDPAMTYEIRR